LEPLKKVDVGIEVSGTIKSVDVDYNAEVKVGQTLANLDTTRLDAQAQQNEAALEAARARVLQAHASVEEAEAQMARLIRVRELSGGKMPSQNDLDTGKANLARAKADEASAKASVAQAQATLDVVRTDISKAVIKSPINGVVLKRSVEPGQTVAAQFQSPTLFTLAEDLTKMELQVDVDEADVGQVKEGQAATFTVDAYPDRTFPAQRHPGPLWLADGGRCRDLQGGVARGQFEPGVASRHDGDGDHHCEQARERRARAQCRPAVRAGSVEFRHRLVAAGWWACCCRVRRGSMTPRPRNPTPKAGSNESGPCATANCQRSTSPKG
jgi:biotin carboxyl carrier protein